MTGRIDAGAAGSLPLERARVALVHDWLTGMRGGEKCLEVLCELFPQADLFTLLHLPGSVSPTIERHRIRTSFLQRLPGAARGYRRYLPLFPRAVEGLRLRDYDLVVSTSHCVAKGVVPPPGALHVCYCHTPMRYVWDRFDDYFGPGRAGGMTRLAARVARGPLQRWDVRSAARVHHFVANSENVRHRLRRYYDRDATVIHPPVDCSRFAPEPQAEATSFLVVGALSGYKRVDLAVEACRRAGVPLVVAGDGPDRKRLQQQARGADVRFLPWQSDTNLPRLFARCRALLFPGVEDFGITPVEVMASGRPVIARAEGGALETVVDGTTGVLVRSEDPEVWAEVLRRFDPSRFVPEVLQRQALRFDRALYAERMLAELERHWDDWRRMVPTR